jgi:hypothetical protein
MAAYIRVYAGSTTGGVGAKAVGETVVRAPTQPARVAVAPSKKARRLNATAFFQRARLVSADDSQILSFGSRAFVLGDATISGTMGKFVSEP